MSDVNAAPPPSLLLVQGDEELLAARAVTAAVEAARAADPGADVREYEARPLSAGEVAEMLSPSLFGGRRVLVIRSGQDARKDLAAALLAYAKNPDPDVTLIVTHPGGAKGKAFADGLQTAGATVVPAMKLKNDRERIAFVRDEFRRHGGRCDEATAAALLAPSATTCGRSRRPARSCSPTPTARSPRRWSPGTTRAGPRSAASRWPTRRWSATCRARWRRCAGRCTSVSTRCRSRTRSPTACGRWRGWPRPAAATPTSWPARSGMPAWKIQKAQERSRGWTPEGLVDAMRAAADCNAAVKGGAEDRGYALEQAVFAVAAARRSGGAR